MAWHHQAYDAIHFLLGVEYLALICFSLYCMYRLWRDSNFHKWSKFFHPILLVGTATRAVFFILQPFIQEGNINVTNRVNMLINSYPSFFFFTDYLIVLFLWAEIYHFTNLGVKNLTLRVVFWTLTALMYGVIVVLYILDFTLSNEIYLEASQPESPYEKAIMTFDACIYVFSSLAFLIYGVRIVFRMSAAIPSASRRKLLRRILIMTFLISICFMIRGGIILWNSWWQSDLSDHWYFDGVYFTLLEWLPLLLMMLILHNAANKKKKVILGGVEHTTYLPYNKAHAQLVPREDYGGTQNGDYSNSKYPPLN